MTIEELLDMTQVYEKILTGYTHCRDINRVHKYIPGHDKLKSKKQKIKEIKIYWEKLADRAIATMLVNKQMDRYGEETKQIDKIPKKEND